MEEYESESLRALLDDAAASTIDNFSKDTTENDAELESLLQDMRDIEHEVHDDPVIRRLMQQDEECGVPMAMYWTTRQMVKWIEEIGFPKYKDCIEKNVITGRHLILLDASTLPKIGIYDFEHIKKMTAAARELIHLDKPIRNFKTAMSNPMIAYMDAKRVRGSYMDHISYRAFLKKNRRWYKHWPMP